MFISEQYIVGIDEAGRGPLAGPVSVAAVAIPVHGNSMRLFDGVDDSKKLSAKKREYFFTLLRDVALENDIHFFVSFSSATYIDSYGIVPAIQRALNEVLAHVVPSPERANISLDGSLHAPECYTKQKTIIGGDASVPIISLASIVAKVSRDAYMVRMSKKFPLYGFEKHKGYGTKMHGEALMEHGASSIHRRTFLRNFLE
ncbi:MAG TPA: ribonuclease HII [Candidatus Kaiserbacteria bacterium]|nr:ribonuclease HII [Candidatus Kaiserbacteria bacterium]